MLYYLSNRRPQKLNNLDSIEPPCPLSATEKFAVSNSRVSLPKPSPHSSEEQRMLLTFWDFKGPETHLEACVGTMVGINTKGMASRSALTVHRMRFLT